MESTYYSLFFVSIAALISPWLSIRIFNGMLPAIIIEIFLGFMIGPHGLQIAISTEQIDFVADLGLAYLMFLSGMELDFALVFQKKQGRIPPWLSGMLFFLVTLFFSLAISFILFKTEVIQNIVVTTLILSTTSVGIVTPSLKEKGWLSTAFGQDVMLYALIADVLSLVLFTAYISFHTTGNAISVLLVFFLVLAFIAVYYLVKVVRKMKALSIVESATSESGLRSSIALILAFLALSMFLGIEMIIGSFLAGAIISIHSRKNSQLIQKLNAIGYGFLLPIFFVNVGLDFNVESFVGTARFWVAMGLCLAGMFLNKVIPAQLFFRRFPVSYRTSAGFLLSSRLSLLIAACQIAVQTGILSRDLQNGFILLAVITCLVSPFLFNRTMSQMAKL